MSGVDWQSLKKAFAKAEALRDGERDEYLTELRAADRAMHAEVVSLLGYADVEAESGAAEMPEVPRYTLIERVGRGGMGTVYRARRSDGAFEQQVAVKVLRRGLDVEDVLRRFEAERRILATLDHPNIARLIDGGSTADGRPYFALEFVDGVPIDRYCEANRLGLRERLALFRSVCSAVEHAHRNLVVHRDIKPANVLVTRDGSVRLLDFGIAKLLDDEHGSHTRTAMRPMTPSHASPEQVRGETITTASDVYSLGVLLYELLTGESPYGREARIEEQILNTRAPRPSDSVAGGATGTTTTMGELSAAQVRRRLRGDLDTIVATALRKAPERRYASVALMASDVDAWLRGLPISAHPDRIGYRLGKFLRRHRFGVAATALALIALVTLVAGYSLRLESERNLARQEAAKARQLADFMQELFRSTSPAAEGVDVKVVDLLADARLALEAAELDPQVRDAVRLSLGEAYVGLGDIEAGRALLEAVQDSERQRYGADHPGERDTLYALARLHWQATDYEAGVATMERVVALERARQPQDPGQLAKAYSEMADALIFAGDLERAKSMIEEAMAIRETLPGQEIAIGNDRVHLGRILDRQGRYDEALAINGDAVEVLEAAAGRDHPDTQNALVSRSSILTNMQRYEASRDVLVEVHAVMQRRAGPNHLRTAQVGSMLASVQTRLGHYEEAEALLLSGLETHLTHLPPDHYTIAYDYYYLSELYQKTGRLAEAEDFARRSLPITVKNLGPEHTDTAYDYANLGAILERRERFDEAREQYEHALTILHGAFGDSHVRTREVLGQLAALCTRSGDDDCAQTYAARRAAADTP